MCWIIVLRNGDRRKHHEIAYMGISYQSSIETADGIKAYPGSHEYMQYLQMECRAGIEMVPYELREMRTSRCCGIGTLKKRWQCPRHGSSQAYYTCKKSLPLTRSAPTERAVSPIVGDCSSSYCIGQLG